MPYASIQYSLGIEIGPGPPTESCWAYILRPTAQFTRVGELKRKRTHLIWGMGAV